nr:hypothetical protein CFP56_27493 [Quercus suber]
MELFWFLVHVQKSDNDVLSLAVTIAWALWTRRNEKRHGGKFMTGLELVNWCGRYIDSFKAVNSIDAASSPSAAPNSADSAKLYKCNTFSTSLGNTLQTGLVTFSGFCF